MKYFYHTAILWVTFIPIVLFSKWYIKLLLLIYTITLFLYTRDATKHGDIV